MATLFLKQAAVAAFYTFMGILVCQFLPETVDCGVFELQLRGEQLADRVLETEF